MIPVPEKIWHHGVSMRTGAVLMVAFARLGPRRTPQYSPT
jgi:hypothetical protein